MGGEIHRLALMLVLGVFGGSVLGSALAFSILTAVLRDFISGPLSSVLEASLFTGAAQYGAVIYRLQLAAVKRLKALE